MIILVASPSASGKTTLVTESLKTFDLIRLVTTTTRKKRLEETDFDYHFISVDEFKSKIEKNDFIEHSEVYGNLYGLEYDEIDKNKDRNSILIVDVQGHRKIKDIYGENVQSIFILPPSIDELRERLLSRNTGDLEEIGRRLESVSYEVSHSSEFDFIVNCGDFGTCIDSFNSCIKEIITKTQKSKHQQKSIW